MRGKAVAIIPARGGSQRIPRKNLLPLVGHPVVAHSIVQARLAESVDRVYVSTDHPEIVRVSTSYGAQVIRRPDSLADEKATSESALLHVLDEVGGSGAPDPEFVVFLQCTSPVRRPEAIDAAVALLKREGADSVFSATLNNRLIWGLRDGEPYSLSYDYHTRKREQDMAVQYRENGSIYAFRTDLLRSTGNRLGGRIRVLEMDYWSSFQIDEPEHLELIEWILTRPQYDPTALFARSGFRNSK